MYMQRKIRLKIIAIRKIFITYSVISQNISKGLHNLTPQRNLKEYVFVTVGSYQVVLVQCTQHIEYKYQNGYSCICDRNVLYT